MARTYTERKRIRKSFARIPEIAPLPNLIELQKTSYANFLQMDIPAEERRSTGLQEVFQSVFPIYDFSGKSQLEFCRYDFDAPKYDVDECRQRGMTYAAPLRVTFRLVVWDIDEDAGSKTIRDIKEQDVYMGDIPLMTENGTFVVNGIERVVVSQMHRSPGVFFDHDSGKSHASGKYLFSARVIPYRGSWLDFEFDAKDIVYARIDRKRKIPVTTFLMALDSAEKEKERARLVKEGKQLDHLETQGMSREEILNTFYTTLEYTKTGKGWKTAFRPDTVKVGKLAYDLVNANTGKVVAAEGAKMNSRFAQKLQEEGLNDILVLEDDLIGRYIALDLINEKTGEIYAEAGDEITPQLLEAFAKEKIKKIPTLDIDHVNVGAYLRNNLMADKNQSREDALIEIYRILRPGEPPTVEGAEALFQGFFFDRERYDLSFVGRVKMNSRLGLDLPDTLRVLCKQDILAIVKVLLELKDGNGDIDDIDNLANRRVRSVGELLENQYRIGLSRMERAIRERMSSVEIDTVMPHDVINAKPAAAVVREFFGTSQLSQFMDQTNPLSEINHKRRLSALGPGGLTRDRATFEVRDVHPTHYGRICPIETPEGPNIGLINSLATYARVNKYGFIETPCRKVVDGKVTTDIIYLTAMDEHKHTIAQANAELNKDNKFIADFVSCRRGGDFLVVHAAEIDLMDISPKQIVSVAASLIPFIENDDANRALMGSNMQRQAVPLLKTDAPLVGTGMEKVVARDSGVTAVAKRDGVVESVDSTRIVVKADRPSGAHRDTGVDIYNLVKYQRSNQNTCINQRPIVVVGDHVKAGDVIADGPSTEMGELALGRNVLVALMPWGGYNFEDSILISERVVKEDVFTSIHIEEFECVSRDTKLGPEEITRDIPNVGDEALTDLDESGITRIGAEVKPGDILVGKITPKGETQLSPEEKLLRAIFGEKAGEVRDTSLRVPPGVEGTVINVRIFSRKGMGKDERSRVIEDEEIARLKKDQQEEVRIIQEGTLKRLKKLFVGRRAAARVSDDNRKVLLNKGKEITEEDLEQIPMAYWGEIRVDNEAVDAELKRIVESTTEQIDLIKLVFQDKMNKLKSGDELPPGVIKMVKVFVAIKRKLQVGDKMAGRHGNKGVISRILPEEDMPYLEDGTPVDIVLNPLGVPSRMNVGQILETHLGWAARALGIN